MFDRIFPGWLVDALNAVGMENVYEIRIRAGFPLSVNVLGRFHFLTANGAEDTPAHALAADKTLVESIVYKAADYSLYAVNSQLRQGFLSLAGGARLGVAGEVVTEGGEVVTIKNVTSVNIRVPHAVYGCSDAAFRLMKKKDGTGIFSTLLLSPPGAGKTTFLRDIAVQIYQSFPHCNTLVLDERGEITAPANGSLTQYAGANVDVLFGATKQYAFTAGIRALRPDVIVADELGGSEDVAAVASALTMGVAVVASVHAGDVDDLTAKPGFESLLSQKLFDRFVVLSSRRGAGTIEGVYDAKFTSLYFTA